MTLDTDKRLVPIFLKRLERVNYICSVENISPNVVVHEIRRSFKRMRAFLKLFSHSTNPFFKESNKQIVLHGKSLSTLREAYVNIQVFDRVATENTLIPERRIKVIKDAFIENNKAHIQNSFSEKENLKAIRKLMKQFESQLQILSDEHPSKKQLLDQFQKSYHKCYNSLQVVNKEFDSEELHRFRKKLKVLYYQMGFLKFIQPKYFKPKSDQLHTITEQLGQDHDLYVFLNEIEQGEYGINDTELEIFRNQIHHLREINLLKLNSRLKHLFADEPEIFNQKMNQVFGFSE